MSQSCLAPKHRASEAVRRTEFRSCAPVAVCPSCRRSEHRATNPATPMLDSISCHTRREFIHRLGTLGIACSTAPLLAAKVLAEDERPLPDPALKFTGPWQFRLPK